MHRLLQMCVSVSDHAKGAIITSFLSSIINMSLSVLQPKYTNTNNRNFYSWCFFYEIQKMRQGQIKFAEPKKK